MGHTGIFVTMSRALDKVFVLMWLTTEVHAQAPVFSPSSYYFTPNSCTSGTYLGQASASGATSYSTDNSFVISVNSQTGALSLGATIAASLTFNVIAANQYGSTQASVTVNANCDNSGTSGVAVVTYGTNYNVPNYNVPNYNVPTYSVPVVQTVPVVVGGLGGGYYGNNNWGNNGYYGNNYGNTGVYSNGQGRCLNNKCYYGNANDNNNNNWNYWNGYTFQGGPYSSYNTLGNGGSFLLG